ncbi:hypothetical protein [Ferroacidibacillus organovorans]|uniref:Restriction endonuclease type IV Mrr domain-containing protein n=2 Tax=Ferroacidibacillus organovorans TaxID=1765683 RepID=A0A101XRG3_9BACL|nr:hypothetical protein [Ferroacidibacillus organovorans]KUO96187.1 hypothetical protein ATW55_14760 [Ferroacidibacillus organovorans]KYP81972.1 hypothetical protein AYJ22_15740 [Ferroacidibacillus organovorans]OAG84958.1 hypothetical protein AYW79_15005 [Ferroacidibacillus organovorans]OPG14855.1 hypothetical protein B2M26_14895 [Ferroacidibacillus organovorans]
MTDLLDEIRNNPCVLYDVNGDVLDYASCRAESLAPSVSASTPAAQAVMPNIKPTLMVFHSRSKDPVITENVKSLSVVVCIRGDNFFEVTIDNLQRSSATGLNFTFDPSQVVEQPIDEARYNQVKHPQIVIDWSKIKMQPGNSSQGQAFEELCRDVVLKNLDLFSNHIFLPEGTDGGRDGVYEAKLSIFPTRSITMKCIMQCKYSVNPETKITRTEIYDEMLKVMVHKPDYYVLVTNRKAISSFVDWFDKVRENKHLPFIPVLVLRTTLEAFISNHIDIWHKYF